MEEGQFEAIIVNPDMGEEIPLPNGPNVGILELGKRLLLAAKEGNTETVRNLMKGGAPFATDWLGTTSLHAAAANGHLETCELLLRSGILKDARTKVEKTPLHMACQEGHSEVVLLLLANGADVNACDMLNMTPLHWAVEKEKTETVRILLQNGADPTMVNKFDKTCFDIANDAERHDIIELLQNEPRRGEYTVIEKSKAEMRLVPQVRKIAQPSSVKPYEIVNVSSVKNIDRPKTAIVLPTYQNKKMGAVAKKTVKTGNLNEEHQSRLAALQLLEEHGIEMLEGEDINLVASAVGSGQTVVLTEAGKQALSLTDEKNLNRIKSSKRQQTDRSSLTPAKFIRISNSNNPLNNAVSNAIKGGSAKKIVRITTKTTPKKIEVNKTLQDINKKLEEARKEAEQYKQLYARKQREAEELRSTLETIARKSEIGVTVSVQDGEEEELDEEELEEEEENEEEDVE